MTTRAQRKMAQDRATTICCLSFMIAVFFGGYAYHFLVGSGYLAGIEVDTHFWGFAALGVAVPSAVTCVAFLWRAIALQEVQ